jgi:hypothetical protein
MSTVLVIKKNENVTNPELVPESTKYVFGEDADQIEGKLKIESENSYDKIIFVEVIPNDSVQGIAFRLLKSKGKLMIDGIVDREAGQALSTDLKIQGFLDIMAAKDPATGRRFLVCQRPEWTLGSTAKLNLVTTKVTVTNLTEDDFIDENALLDESNIPDPSKESDCGTGNDGKKRACKNCTCGLADKDEEPKTVEEKVAKASSCGNCYKGDAFRCGSCPFLGKPAFEPGQEKVVLAMGDDDI